MKKLLKSALFFAATGLATSPLHALPVGNPAEPSLLIDGTMWEGSPADPCDPCSTWCDAISIRAGYYGDYVFDRVLKTNAKKTVSDMAEAPKGTTITNSSTPVERPNFAYNKQLQDAEWFTNAAYLALNIWDRFDVFCTLGATNGYFKADSAAFGVVGLLGATTATNAAAATDLPNVFLTQGVVELYTDTTFSWSVGARGALWECGCATLGAEFQYAQSKPRVETLNAIVNTSQFSIHKPRGYKGKALPLPLTAGTTAATDTKSATIKYHEWQAGMALSYRLNMLVPYIGVKWSRATFDADGIRIAQPKLATEILNLTSWNPTLAGSATGASNKYGDFLQIVSMEINKMKSRKSCGLAIGATLIDADKWSVTGEARLIDERAAHVNAQFRF